MHQRRLRALLRGALLAAGAAPAAFVVEAGCSSSGAAPTDFVSSGPGSGSDASIATSDGSPPFGQPSPNACPSPPSFDAAAPWTGASICDASTPLPQDPQTQCCSASYFVPLACVPAQGVVLTPPKLPLVGGSDGGADGGDLVLDCEALCALEGGATCALVVADDAQTGVGCQTPQCVFLGRRPQGFLESSAAREDVAAAWCRAHALEAASVTAFQMLRAELRAHGAPKALLRSASRAARDEKRHARITRSIARRFGGAPRAPELVPARPRDLEAIAIENAVEGCVRELFGVVVARWQADHAEDVNVRAAMARLAADELRHAALAFQVAAWTHGRLSPAARARVEASRSRAVEELAEEVQRPVPPDVARALGLPSAQQARALIDALATL